MRLFAPLALTLALATAGAAQSTENYGSVYSGFGLGQRADAPTSQAQMLGGAGIALGGQFANPETPALLADLGLTAFAVNLQVQGVRGEDGLGNQSELVAGTLGGLRLAFPLKAGRLGLGIAYTPYSRVQYEVFSDGEIDLDDDPATTTPYRVQYEGGGGLQTVSVGLGGRLSPAFQVGASVDVRFGTVERRTRTRFPLNPSDFSEVLSTTDTQLAGATGTIGAGFQTPKLFGDADNLRIVGSLTLPTKLWGDRTRLSGFGLSRDTLSTVDVEATLPLTGRLGAAYRPARGLLVSVEGLYEPWSSFEADFAVPGYAPTGASQAELRDRFRFGGGVEIVPSGGRRQAGYFARTAYRLGGYAERSLVETGGTGINTLALTGGVSLPALAPTARFDLGGEIGVRGVEGLSSDGSQSLVRDLFFKATATINFGERWFVRRQFD
jgi:hypothetical protein